MNDDARLMRKAVLLAERGRGTTSPNPMVGALVVDREGVIVGRGAHLVAGGPHAEVVALEDAGSRARGATLYCTLEPCAHTGRTGPCAPLVALAGIRRAVVAMDDPNPLVNGRGLAHLRERGIDVAVGVEREAAARQNAAFLKGIREQRPYVILKVALGVDGCVAAPGGQRTALTGPIANRRVQRQRAEVDAIAVGSGTILADDPLLTARGAYRARTFTRVIFDRRLRTPASARVLSTVEQGPVIVVCGRRSERAAPERASALIAAGARLLVPDDDDLPSACRALYGIGVTSLVLEGGPELHRAALAADIVDAAHLYITPRRVGPGGVRWLDAGRIAWDTLTERHARWLGDDVLVEAQLKVLRADVHGNH
jgi:diaminohydroxyphosphoribosylaminopyrimidine deaminase/5-amino-6-(5-phosphoribosylamino)uracil reductase